MIFRSKGQAFVLETTAKARDRMVRPIAEVRDQYVPYFSIDRSLRMFMYGGYMRHIESGAVKMPVG